MNGGDGRRLLAVLNQDQRGRPRGQPARLLPSHFCLLRGAREGTEMPRGRERCSLVLARLEALGHCALHTQLLMLLPLFNAFCFLLKTTSYLVVFVAVLQVKTAESLPTGNT